MYYFTEISARLAEFQSKLSNLPKPRCDNGIKIADLIDCYDGSLPTDGARAYFCDCAKTGPNLATLDPWLAIVFPTNAAEQVGAFGTSIKWSDILRWEAEIGGRRAEYYLTIADKLEALPSERIVVQDQSDYHLKTLQALTETLDIFDEQPELWCRNDAEWLLFLLRAALREAEYGQEQRYVGFEYPVDIPVPENEDGCVSTGLVMEAGYVLRLAAERAEYMTPEERSKILTVLNYYPDENFELEVDLRDKSFWITDLQVLMEPIPAIALHPAVGSVVLDNFGSASKFSSDPLELDFRLHRPSGQVHGEDLMDMCFLVSEHLTYAASFDVA